MTSKYNTHEGGRVTVIFNWLCQEGLKFMQTLNDEEQDNVG